MTIRVTLQHESRDYMRHGIRAGTHCHQCMYRWESQRVSRSTTRSQNCWRHISIWVTFLHTSRYCMRHIILCVTFLPTGHRLPSQYVWESQQVRHITTRVWQNHVCQISIWVTLLDEWIPFPHESQYCIYDASLYASHYSMRHIILCVTFF